MNPRLMSLIKANTKTIDPRIVDGLSYHEGKKTIAYLDNLWRVHASSFPKCFEYIGIDKCSPDEDFQYTTRLRDSQRRYDICKNDLRLVNIRFKYHSFNGSVKISKDIVIKQYIAFIRRHDEFYLNDTLYSIRPVVSDIVFSVKPDKIFAKLLKIKLWFESYSAVYLVDGRPEFGQIYHSKIYNKTEESDGFKTVKMKTTLVHYLLAKYGMTKTLSLFGITDYQFLTHDEFLEIRDTLDRDKYVVCESQGIKPKRTYLSNFYNPMKTLLVVNKEQFYQHNSASDVICGIIHIAEHWTSLNRISPSNANDVNTWRTTLGELIKGGPTHPAIIDELISRHMSSLDEYIDEMVKTDLMSIGVEINDIYEMLIYVVKNFRQLTLDANKNNTGNSWYGKRLEVLNYLYSNVSMQVVRTYFGLMGLRLEQEKNPDLVIKEEDILKQLSYIKTTEIMRIKKDHAELMVVDDPTDNPLLKIGRIVVPQEKSDKIKTGKETFSINDARNVFTFSLLECGAALDMSKGDPAGFNRINLFLKLNEGNIIVKNPDLNDIRDSTESMLLGGPMTNPIFNKNQISSMLNI